VDILFDFLKFLRVRNVIGWGPAEFVDLFIHSLGAIAGIRVVGKKLGRLLSFCLGVQLFKELSHRARVVAGVVEDLRAQDVGL